MELYWWVLWASWKLYVFYMGGKIGGLILAYIGQLNNTGSCVKGDWMGEQKINPFFFSHLLAPDIHSNMDHSVWQSVFLEDGMG